MPQNRKIWSEHTLTGWYLGNARFHYRCHEVWVKDTKRTRISQTVFFKTNFITKPEFTTTDALLRSTEDLVQVLRGDTPVKGDARKAIDMLLDIFKKKRTNSHMEIDVQRQQILKAATNLASSEVEELDAVTKSDTENESGGNGGTYRIVPLVRHHCAGVAGQQHQRRVLQHEHGQRAVLDQRRVDRQARRHGGHRRKSRGSPSAWPRARMKQAAAAPSLRPRPPRAAPPRAARA